MAFFRHLLPLPMANILEDGSELPPRTKTRPTFVEQYPDYPLWLDGNTWELDHEEDLHSAPIHAFRASLYYQAQVNDQRLVTRQVIRTNDQGVLIRKLLVRAEPMTKEEIRKRRRGPQPPLQ